MFQAELELRIENLQHQLATREEEYTNAVRSHKDYSTLRAIRENITELKKMIESLHDQQ